MILTKPDFIALAITFKLAGVTTLTLLLLGTPLAWWLSPYPMAFQVSVRKVVVVSPLVLPPTVLGFYLLVALGPHGPIGSIFQLFGGQPPVL